MECNEKVLEKLSFTEKFKALWDLKNTSSSDWKVGEGVFESFVESLGSAPLKWLGDISDSACRWAGEKYCTASGLLPLLGVGVSVGAVFGKLLVIVLTAL